MRFSNEFSGQLGCSVWWDLDKDTELRSWGSLGEGNWAPLAGTLGVMHCCCWGCIWSTSSRSQAHYMSICEAEESWQRWAANLAGGVQPDLSHGKGAETWQTRLEHVQAIWIHELLLQRGQGCQSCLARWQSQQAGDGQWELIVMCST